MTDGTISVELVIQNLKGLHARAAAAFVKTIEDMDVAVEVEKQGQTVDGCSIMGLMMLAASKGSVIKISASGKDAKKAIENLSSLINNKFGEE